MSDVMHKGKQAHGEVKWVGNNVFSMHSNTADTVTMSLEGCERGGGSRRWGEVKVETRLGLLTIQASIQNNKTWGQSSRICGAGTRQICRGEGGKRAANDTEDNMHTH